MDFRLFVCVLYGLAVAACGGHGEHKHDHARKDGHHQESGKEAAEKEEHHHEHAAPHGGTLVALGDEFAHVELVLDAGSGTLTAYVLDGEAENAVRIRAENISIRVMSGLDAGRVTLVLAPVANDLTGETAEESSQYQAQSDDLVGAQSFTAVIESLTVKGVDFSDVEFHFPEGNE